MKGFGDVGPKVHFGDLHGGLSEARTLRPIINYNLKKGWYLTSVPVMTANWRAPSDNCLTIPSGGGFGRIVKWGKQPLDLSAQAICNVEKPVPEIGQGPNLTNEGDTWTLRLQLKLLFPK